MAGHKWSPIEDLPDDWRKLASSELAGLFAVWKEQVVRLKDSPAYREFQARLRREWAIETGIIEGLYDIDRGVTRTLIERGLHASLIAHGDANKPAEEIIPMLKDHEGVVEGLFDFVGQKRQLSTSYIKQIHQALTTHQETATGIDEFGRRTRIPLLRGDWKKWPNNPTRTDGLIHEYCPPEQTASEMDRLIELHQEHTQQEVPPEVEAAWLHHRFTRIHPFQDGNGRVARALASLIFLRAGWFPLVIHRDIRGEYIDYLEQADGHDMSPLVRLFANVQKKAFNQATNLSKFILLPHDSISQIITQSVERLKRREAVLQQFQGVGLHLQNITREKLQPVANELSAQLKRLNEKYFATIFSLQSLSDDTPLKSGALEIADRFDYRADLGSYFQCVCFVIAEKRSTQITFAFHAASDLSPPLLAVSAWLSTGDQPYTYLPVCREIFQCAMKEEEASIVSRFAEWLDETLLTGIEQWRRQL